MSAIPVREGPALDPASEEGYRDEQGDFDLGDGAE